MPGLGVRNFTTEVLTSANVNGYLMQQSVMNFADAATRTAQFSAAGISPSAGMMSYRTDIGALEIFTGSTWKALAVTSAAAAAGAYTGTPIQIGRLTFTNLTTTTSSSLIDATGGAYTFTPKLATSRLEVVAELLMQSSSQGSSAAINRDGTVLTYQNQAHQFYAGTSDLYSRPTVSWFGPAVSTAAQVFKVQIRAYNGGSITINQGTNWESHLTITEWAA